jgi:hypothetical protein
MCGREVLVTDECPQFGEIVWAFFSNLCPNLFERWKVHVAPNTLAPLDPDILPDPLHVVEKRLLVAKVKIPVNGVSTVIVTCFV